MSFKIIPDLYYMHVSTLIVNVRLKGKKIKKKKKADVTSSWLNFKFHNFQSWQGSQFVKLWWDTTSRKIGKLTWNDSLDSASSNIFISPSLICKIPDNNSFRPNSNNLFKTYLLRRASNVTICDLFIKTMHNSLDNKTICILMRTVAAIFTCVLRMSAPLDPLPSTLECH